MFVPLTNKQRQIAVNLWNRQYPKETLIAKQRGSKRNMLPMIINGKFILLCPDTGYKTYKIPRKIIDNYLEHYGRNKKHAD